MEWEELLATNYKNEPRRDKLAREMTHVNDFVAPSNQALLDTFAIGFSPIPVVGDIAGGIADANMFINDPESRTATNFGLSALGLLPFVPSAAGVVKRAATSAVTPKFIKEAREYEARLWGGSYGVGQFSRAAKTSPQKKIIIAGRQRYNQMRREAGLPEVENWSIRPETLIQSMDSGEGAFK